MKNKTKKNKAHALVFATQIPILSLDMISEDMMLSIATVGYLNVFGSYAGLSHKNAHLVAAMLQHEGVPPERFAYDRPSPKLVGFMRKHYGLSDFVPQQNKFVIFQQYFMSEPQKAPSIYDSVKDRPLTARGARGGIRPR